MSFVIIFEIDVDQANDNSSDSFTKSVSLVLTVELPLIDSTVVGSSISLSGMHALWQYDKATVLWMLRLENFLCRNSGLRCA